MPWGSLFYIKIIGIYVYIQSKYSITTGADHLPTISNVESAFNMAVVFVYKSRNFISIDCGLT